MSESIETESEIDDANASDPYVVHGMQLRAERSVLSKRLRADARAFAEGHFSSDGTAPLQDRMDWFESDLDDFFAHAGTRARLLFTACLLTATWIAPLLVGRPFTRLGSLDVPLRIEALEAMERAPLVSLALFALKAVSSFVYYEHPDAAREIGWDQRCLGNAHVKRRLDVVGS